MANYNDILFVTYASLFFGLVLHECFAKESVSATMDALVKQGQEHSKLLALQAIELADLQSIVEEQNTKITAQEKVIKDYTFKFNKLEEEVADLQHQYIYQHQNHSEQADIHDQAEATTLANHFNVSKTELSYYSEKKFHSATKREAFRQRSSTLKGGENVAFHAIIRATTITNIGLRQKIVFPDVLTNIGSGFHNQLGVFIAPQAGVYLFSASITSHHNGNVGIFVGLAKNGNFMANVVANGAIGHFDQGSVTVVTELSVGDEVWVDLIAPADTSIHGDSYSSFAGCLVAPQIPSF